MYYSLLPTFAVIATRLLTSRFDLPGNFLRPKQQRMTIVSSGSEHTPLLSKSSRERTYGTLAPVVPAGSSPEHGRVRSKQVMAGDRRRPDYSFFDIDAPFCSSLGSPAKFPSTCQDTPSALLSGIESFLGGMWEQVSSLNSTVDFESHRISADGTTIY